MNPAPRPEGKVLLKKNIAPFYPRHQWRGIYEVLDKSKAPTRRTSSKGRFVGLYEIQCIIIYEAGTKLSSYFRARLDIFSHPPIKRDIFRFSVQQDR